MKIQHYFFILLTMGVLAMPWYTFARGPSFPCEKASTKNEKLICESSQLSELDYDLGKLYSQLIKSLDDSKVAQLRNTQRTWLKNRDISCSNINCLEKRYKKRIAELMKHSEDYSGRHKILLRYSSAISWKENEYSWSKQDWQKYIYDEGFIRCGDNDKLAHAIFSRVNSFKFNYKSKCIRPPKVDHGWYDSEWDERPLKIIKLGTPNDYVVLLTVSGMGADGDTWEKTLVYKKSSNNEGVIVAEMIGWLTDPEIQTDSKIQFDTSTVDINDYRFHPSYCVYTKLEITKNGIKVKDRYRKPTSYYLKLERERQKKQKARKIAEAYERVSRIASSSSYSLREKKEKIRVVQNSVSHEIFTAAIRKLPIADNGKFVTFDTYMRKQISSSKSHRSSSRSSSTPIERDPVGAGMSIFFNSSAGNIKKQLGLP